MFHKSTAIKASLLNFLGSIFNEGNEVPEFEPIFVELSDDEDPFLL